MKKGLIGLLSLLLVAVLAGCGGSAPEPKENVAPADKPKVESNAAAEGSGTVTPAPAPEEPAPAAAEGSDTAKEEAAAAPATVDGLVGTKWKYDEIELTFKEGNKVALKGGPLAALAPDGLVEDYTIEDGVFEVSVMGQTYSGTYADGKLTVDGTEAVKQQ
jgi:hypothetical protein